MSYVKPTIGEKARTLGIRKKKLRQNATKSELIFRDKLKEIGLPFNFQKGFIARDYYCITDFYLKKPYKLCIEIDGGYHLDEAQIIKDNRRDYYLLDRKFKIWRLTNEEAESITIEQMIKIIESVKAKKAHKIVGY